MVCKIFLWLEFPDIQKSGVEEGENSNSEVLCFISNHNIDMEINDGENSRTNE